MTRECGRCGATFPADAMIDYNLALDDWWCVDCYAELVMDEDTAYDVGARGLTIATLLADGLAARALSPLDTDWLSAGPSVVAQVGA